MRISNSMMAGNILRNISKHTERLLALEEQVATGKAINRPSDDPIGIGQVLSYRKKIAALDQYNENIANAKMQIKLTDSILESVGEILDQAKGFISDAQTKLDTAFAQQISDLREQLFGLANAKSNGSYLFAGEKTDTAPFNGSGTYAGDSGNMDFLIGENGMRITLETDGSSLFGSSPDSVFDILENLETAFNSGDSAAVQAQLAPLNDVIDTIENARSLAAGRYKLLEATENRYVNFKTNMQKMLSQTEDVDMAQTIVELQIQKTSYESTLATSAQIIRPSLIDFLS